MLLERLAPRRSGVVHQDVERALTRCDLAREALALGLRREVGRYGDAFADLRQLGRHVVADLGLAGGDVHLHARFHEAPGDHQSDAARASGDERGLALDVEQFAAHGGGPYTRIDRAPIRVPRTHAITTGRPERSGDGLGVAGDRTRIRA